MHTSGTTSEDLNPDSQQPFFPRKNPSLSRSVCPGHGEEVYNDGSDIDTTADISTCLATPVRAAQRGQGQPGPAVLWTWMFHVAVAREACADCLDAAAVVYHGLLYKEAALDLHD